MAASQASPIRPIAPGAAAGIPRVVAPQASIPLVTAAPMPAGVGPGGLDASMFVEPAPPAADDLQELAKGTRCWYHDQKDDQRKIVTIVKVHYDDPPTPYYTIDVDGQERHTVHDRLTPEAATPSPPARSRPPTETEAPPPPRCLRCFVCVKS